MEEQGMNTKNKGKTCIILIGMPASGKSTVGVILAKMLGMDFLDTDLLIQKKEGDRLEGIIEKKGIETFLDIEADVCRSLDADHTVIATGGSVIYRDGAMQCLKELGTVVYLKVSLDALRSRLQDIKGRGVVLKDGQTLEELFLERTGLYERYADATVDESMLSLEETVRLVKDSLEQAVKRGDVALQTGELRKDSTEQTGSVTAK